MVEHHLAAQGYRYVVINLPSETFSLLTEFLSTYSHSKLSFYQHFLLDFIVRENPDMPIHATYTGKDAKKLRMWIDPQVYEGVESKATGTSIRAYCYTALIHFLTKWQLEKARVKSKRRKAV